MINYADYGKQLLIQEMINLIVELEGELDKPSIDKLLKECESMSCENLITEYGFLYSMVYDK